MLLEHLLSSCKCSGHGLYSLPQKNLLFNNNITEFGAAGGKDISLEAPWGRRGGKILERQNIVSSDCNWAFYCMSDG